MRSVLITGASTGIGEACVLRFDRAGFRVFAAVRREEDGRRLRAEGSPRLTPVFLDVTDADSIARAKDDVAHSLANDGLDALVNNAGIAVAGPLEQLPLDALRDQLEVNVVGQVAVTQAFLGLVRRVPGRIVLMGSIGGRLATPFLAPYCASKFALEAIADALRLELLPWNIRVSIVEPGGIATPIWSKSERAADDLQARFVHGDGDDYTAALARIREAAAATGQRGAPASLVADAVMHAVTADSPKTRYVVGRDARLRAWLARFVPDRVRDRLIVRALKLPVPS